MLKYFEQLFLSATGWDLLRDEIFLDAILRQFGGFGRLGFLTGIRDINQHLRWVVILNLDLLLVGNAHIHKQLAQRTALLGVLVDVAEEIGGEVLSLGTLLVECFDAHVLQDRDQELIRQDPQVGEVRNAWGFAFTVFDLLVVDPGSEDAKGFDGVRIMHHGLTRTLREASVEGGIEEGGIVAHIGLVKDETLPTPIGINDVDSDHFMG